MNMKILEIDDKNKVGTIDPIEMKELFEIFDAQISENDLNKMIKTVDANNDGVIDF